MSVVEGVSPAGIDLAGTDAAESDGAVPDTAEPDAAPRPQPWWVVPLIVLGVACLVTMSQLDRLIGEVVGPAHDVHSLSDVIGFTPWAAKPAWVAWWWRTNGETALPLIREHTFVDLVFIACYTALLVTAVRSSRLADPARRRWLCGIGALVFFDLVEDEMLLLATAAAPGPFGLAVEIGATSLKWIVALGLLAAALFGNSVGETLRPRLRNALTGLYAQRLGVIVVGGIAFLSLSSWGGELGDQVPDIYRGLLSSLIPWAHATSWTALTQLLSALVAAFVVTIVLGHFGRQRGWRYAQGPPTENARLRYWALTAAVIAALGWFAAGYGALDAYPGSGVPTTVWLVAGLVIVILPSLALRRHTTSVGLASPLIPPVPGRMSPRARRRRRAQQHRKARLAKQAVLAEQAARGRLTFTAGDLLTAAWVSVVFLAPFASLVPVLALYPVGEFRDSRFGLLLPLTLVIALALLALAMGLTAFVWHKLRTRWRPPATPASEGAHVLFVLAVPPSGERDRLSPAEESRTRRIRLLENCSVGAACIFVLLVAAFPLWFGQWIGPLAITIGMLGVITGVVGWLILRLGDRRPPALFEFLRLRSTPVITLAIGLPILLATLNPLPLPHAIATVAIPEPLSRPTVQDALDGWSEQACTFQIQTTGTTKTTETTETTEVQPLILIAAEGGGIRAATWTVDVARTLFQPRTDCTPAKSVFASSGASGGSVGLAALAVASRTDKTRVDIATLSSPSGLGTDLAGMFSSDLIAGSTGIRLASYVGGDPAPRDRARLQELAWEADTSSDLEDPFDSRYRPGTGYLLFNSTDAVSNCKVVVSQLRLSEGTDRRVPPAQDDHGAAAENDRHDPHCTGPDTTLSHAVDLLGAFGSDCRQTLRWSTASFLSARFPFVSPSGRVDDSVIRDPQCKTGWSMQLLDGGLVDNSALGTVSDLLPSILSWTREHNAEAGQPVVVPLVLWISNGTPADLVAANGNARPEWVAPLLTLNSAKAAQQSPEAWLSRLTDQLTVEQICPATVAERCTAVVEEIQTKVVEEAQTGLDEAQKKDQGQKEKVPTSVAVAPIGTRPAVSVPLGWTLSGFTTTRLDQAAEALTKCSSSASATDGSLQIADGYGSLGALLDLFGSCTGEETRTG